MVGARLETQFLANRDLLLGFIYSLTRDYDTAEEVFQEVSLVITGSTKRHVRRRLHGVGPRGGPAAGRGTLPEEVAR